MAYNNTKNLLMCTWLAAALSGCQQSTDDIAKNVSSQLETRLSRETPAGAPAPRIGAIKVVQDSGTKYQGVVTVLAYGSSAEIPLDIVADRKNVIYRVQDSEWQRAIASLNRARFANVEGQYSNIASDDAAVWDSFPAELKQQKTEFSQRLQTVTPVKRAGSVLFGSGCKSHECGSNVAAWAVDTNTARGYAITMVEGSTFHIYGGNPENLPRPLLDWAVESGMNTGNLVVMR
ncbi:hypothetical protein [Caballeronia sp. LZ028]|uniref:hypothetical protein n=1 Tax=Caballeronia sp. LZ028 TaxID=3038563 RepID=UPI00285BB771|nr:hypothetical protein [Caballeronia sp. LZ028]MDR5765010.1 hypothetical protein [Caballeronia sp. LZ028]